VQKRARNKLLIAQGSGTVSKPSTLKTNPRMRTAAANRERRKFLFPPTQKAKDKGVGRGNSIAQQLARWGWASDIRSQ